jgi:hypothetical protein
LVSSALLALSRDASVRERLEAKRILAKRVVAIPTDTRLLVTPFGQMVRGGWRVTEALVRELAANATSVGAEFLAVIVPSSGQVYDDLWAQLQSQPLRKQQRWMRDAPQRRLADFGRSAGIQVVDLLPGLREAARSDPFLYYPWNGHWTAAGHRVVASIIEAALPKGKASSRRSME